ncbi:MAG: FixH family protein [Verrucomicrobiales bacterium]|nr:FixH family protein [Verrucomicrobiales bacterium]
MDSPPPTPRPTLWPLGIVAAFAVFILGTASLIVFSIFHREDLVTADYYEQELLHQEHINRLERTHPLRDQVRVAYSPESQQMLIALPPLHANLHPTGSIHLYRPSAAREDRHFDLDLDPLGRQALDTRDLPQGLWRVRIRWTASGHDYAIDERIVVRHSSGVSQ